MKQWDARGLSNIPLLQGLSPEEIAHVLSAGRVLSRAEGEHVVRAGEEGQELFVILSGAVRVETNLGGARQVITQFCRGDVFGEIGFVSSGARTADVVASEEVQVLAMSRAYLERLMAEVPPIAARLLFNLSVILCERLKLTTRSWMDSEYEKILSLFRTLATETEIQPVFNRFVDALARAFSGVKAVRFAFGGQSLCWPEPCGAPLPSAELVESLQSIHIDSETATTICPVAMQQCEQSYIVLAQEAGTTPSAMELALLSWVAHQLGLVVDRILLHKETQALATIDALTGVFNRNIFQKELTREITRAQRYGNALSLLMADIDHFKQINDSHGHLAGDQVLRTVAQIFQQGLRRVDVVCRYGGEEFAVILPVTDGPGAYAVAERLRTAVEAHVIELEGKRLRLTVSFGVATQTAGECGESLLRRADDALYCSKSAGRNRTTSAGAPSQPPAPESR